MANILGLLRGDAGTIRGAPYCERPRRKRIPTAYSAEALAAALRDIDAGMPVMRAAEMHAIHNGYLYMLKSDRKRRTDAQALR